MGRPPRLELPGVPLHVVQRGNNRATCFFNDVDRRFYLKCLREAVAARGCSLHAYVLMTNHVHLLVTPPEEGAVGAMMQDIGRRYVRIINNIHGRTGSLWEGRFKSSLIDSEAYLLLCHRYIEANPVRAGMVTQAADYAWSSHKHFIGDRTDPAITEHALFLGLAADKEQCQRSFAALSNERVEPQVVEEIRLAINTDSALGSDNFMDNAEALLGRSVRPPKRGRPAKVVTGKLL